MRNSTHNPKLVFPKPKGRISSDKNDELIRKWLDEVSTELGIKVAVWSMYEVTDFNVVPYPEARVIIYDQNTGWGAYREERIPRGSSWAHLWVVADRLITKSNDHDHVFIEGFKYNSETHSLTIQCGS